MMLKFAEVRKAGTVQRFCLHAECAPNNDTHAQQTTTRSLYKKPANFYCVLVSNSGRFRSKVTPANSNNNS